MIRDSTQPLTEVSTDNQARRAKGRPAPKADSFTSSCESYSIKYGGLDVSQQHGPQRSATGIDLPPNLSLLTGFNESN
jgi:hypothetical protein